MDHLSLEQENVAERYLLGQLGEAEAARFEEHFLDCPQCLEQLELGRRLRDGLRATAAAQGTGVARLALLAWLLRRGRGLQLGLVAGLLALVLLPWALLAPKVAELSGERRRLAHELGQALEPQAGALRYLLSPERSTPGGEPGARISLGREPEWVVLALDLGPEPAAGPYRVRLLGADGETLWRSDPLETGADGRLELSLHSSWLVDEGPSNVLGIEVHVADTAEGIQPVARFLFRLQQSG